MEFQLWTSTDFGSIAVGAVKFGKSLVKYELVDEHIAITHKLRSLQLIEHLELYESEKTLEFVEGNKMKNDTLESEKYFCR